MEKEKSEDQNNLGTEETSLKDENLTKEEAPKTEIDPLEKISELEEKIVRQYAEMENQRRRYERKKMMHLSMVVSPLQKKL